VSGCAVEGSVVQPRLTWQPPSPKKPNPVIPTEVYPPWRAARLFPLRPTLSTTQPTHPNLSSNRSLPAVAGSPTSSSAPNVGNYSANATQTCHPTEVYPPWRTARLFPPRPTLATTQPTHPNLPSNRSLPAVAGSPTSSSAPNVGNYSANAPKPVIPTEAARLFPPRSLLFTLSAARAAEGRTCRAAQWRDLSFLYVVTSLRLRCRLPSLTPLPLDGHRNEFFSSRPNPKRATLHP
jgi:hypothetical protein